MSISKKMIAVLSISLGISLSFSSVDAENVLQDNQFSKSSGWDFYVDKGSKNAGSYARFDEGKAIVHAGQDAVQNPRCIQVTKKNITLDTEEKYIVTFNAQISESRTIQFAYRRDGEDFQTHYWPLSPERNDYQFNLTVKNLSGSKEKLSGTLFLFLGAIKGATLTLSDIRIETEASASGKEETAEIGKVIYSVSGDSWGGWVAKPANCTKAVNHGNGKKWIEINIVGEGEATELGNRDVFGKVAKAKSHMMVASAEAIMEKYKGYEIEIAVGVKGKNIPSTLPPWEGVYIAANYKTPTLAYNHCYYNDLCGTFDWRTVTYRTRIPTDMVNASLSAGLIASSGTVCFDHLKITISGVPFAAQAAPVDAAQQVKVPRVRGFGTGLKTPGNENAKKMIAEFGKEWNANAAVLWFSQTGSFSESDAALEKWMDSVEAALPEARKAGVYLILKFANNWKNREKGGHSLFFEKPEYADKLVEQWEKVARRFKGRKEIYGFVLQNELPVRMPIADGSLDYPGLMERVAQAINKIDPERILIVQPEEWWGTRGFEKLRPLNAKNVMYAVHFYAPFVFSHQGVDAFLSKKKTWQSYPYPGSCDGIEWNKEKLRQDLQPVIEFQKATNAPIIVDEFSFIRWAPGDSRYLWLKDAIGIFEELGWSWTYHSYPEWPGWSPVLGNDPWDERKPKTPTKTETLLKEWFKKNEKPVF